MSAIFPCTLLSLVLLFVLIGQSWRRAVVTSIVLFYGLIVVITELLSPWHLLSTGPIVAAWSIVLAAATAINLRLWRNSRRVPGVEFSRNLVEVVCLIGTLTVIIPVGLLASVARPGIADALGYHMPRVVFWTQSRSVDMFPTSFPQQITLQPLNEYLGLHVYILSNGQDKWMGIVQWVSFVATVVAVSLIAERLGGSRKAQAAAALFCATIPAAVLQASGPKNDLTVTFTLAAMAYFALNYFETRRLTDLLAAGISLSLGLLTKGTAYIFAPALLAGLVFSRPWREQLRLLRMIPVIACCVLALNMPQYLREIRFRGSPLGMASVYSDGEYRYANDRIDPRAIFSNIVRNVALQFNFLNIVVKGVYHVDALFHIDTNDPATTWPGTRFGKMPNYCWEHEMCAPSPLQVIVFAYVGLLLLWSSLRTKTRSVLACYFVGVFGMFVCFCIAVRWQPWHTRMQAAILMLTSPAVGIAAVERLQSKFLVASCAAFALLGQPYVYRNYSRKVISRASVLWTEPTTQYFSDYRDTERDYRKAVTALRASECRDVGIDNSYDATATPPRQPPEEYPVMALLKSSRPETRFIHVGVHDSSRRYLGNLPFSEPCAVICLACKGDIAKTAQYQGLGEPQFFGPFAVVLQKGHYPK
jgi:4-amino-4-deoxy-L-arabinose transferase-like glycosyltransferase